MEPSRSIHGAILLVSRLDGQICPKIGAIDNSPNCTPACQFPGLTTWVHPPKPVALSGVCEPAKAANTWALPRSRSVYPLHETGDYFRLAGLPAQGWRGSGNGRSALRNCRGCFVRDDTSDPFDTDGAHHVVVLFVVHYQIVSATC